MVLQGKADVYFDNIQMVLDLNVVDYLKTDSRDFHIITDLGGGFGKDLNQKLG